MIAEARREDGEHVVVLRIDEIERYAGSVILAARQNPRGVPALEERMLASRAMSFPRIPADQRLPRDSELPVLECVVHLLLEHDLSPTRGAPRLPGALRARSGAPPKDFAA